MSKMELFEQGKIKLYRGDCMELMAGYPDGYFDLAIVDPPYGIGASAKSFIRQGKQTGKSKCVSGLKYEAKSWDNATPDENYFIELARVSKNQIVWGGNYFNLGSTSCYIVWDKDNGNNLYADCELAWASFGSAVRKVKFKWHGMLQQDMKNKEERCHPTQKPIRLYQWLLDNYADDSCKVLDTHLGSGSSAIAAHYFGCEFTGIEIDEDYYKAAVKRFIENTKQQDLFQRA